MAFTYMIQVKDEKLLDKIEETFQKFIDEHDSIVDQIAEQILTAPIGFIDQRLEELECIKLFLNKHNVPTERDGKPLSYVGRIEAYAEMKKENDMPTTLHAAGLAAESIIKPLAPKPRTGWKDRSDDLRSMPFFEVASAWLHKQSGFFVISSVEVPEPDTIGPEYHLSLSRRDGGLVIRVTSQEAQDILKDFDAEMFEEDNHISGATRHFWRPVNQHLVGKECECKADEPAIKEDKGDYVWRPLQEK